VIAYAPPKYTHCTIADVIAAISEAYESTVGGEIPGGLLLCLVAQSALETGRWAKMFCWNLGNIRGVGPTGEWTSFSASEIIDGKEVHFDPGPNNRFAASPDLLTGAKFYVSFLCVASHPPTPNRYQAAVDAASRGDVHGFVAGLRAGGYFTANPGRYQSAEDAQVAYLEELPAMHAWLQHSPPEEFPLSDTDRSPPPEPEAA
jgi:hypothetical protein